jgi:hypothetical protein
MLRDLGLGAITLPMLAPRNLWGATAYPKRLFIHTWTNGALGVWPQTYSKTDETSFTLPDTLKLLEPHRQDIILIGGMDLKSARDDGGAAGTGDSHHTLAHILTGTKSVPVLVSGKPDGNRAMGGGQSLDQFVADAIMKRSPTPVRSLELRAWEDGSTGTGVRGPSFRGPAVNGVDQNNTPELNPLKVYERVFGAALPDGAAGMSNTDRLAQIRRERKSVFDYVKRDMAALQRRLGTEDRQKLERHITSVREVETELDGLQLAMPAAGGKCAPPKLDTTTLNLRSAELVPTVAQLHIRIAVIAMSCNLTRVATFSVGNLGNDSLTFPWLGVDFRGKGDEYTLRSHHDIAHRAYDSPDHTRRKILCDQWHFGLLAETMQRMKEVPEGAGTMLDSALVASFNSGSEGRSHAIDRLPWVIGGRAGGYLKTGRYFKLGDWGQSAPDKASKLYPHNGLLAAMANAMDAPVKAFGDPAYAGEELPGIRG